MNQIPVVIPMTLEDHEEILKAIENRDLLLGKISIDNALNHWMQRSELNDIKDLK